MNPGSIRRRWRRADGGGGASVAPAFNPNSLSLTGWFRDATVSPWAPTASAGSSGTNGSLSDASGPTAGSALNGHNGAIFSGALQKLTGTATVSNLFSATAWSIACLVNPATTVLTHSVNATYADPAILTDSTNGFGPILSFTTAGFTISHYDGVSWKEKSVAYTGGTSVVLVQAWFDGTNLNLQLNSAAAASVASGNMSAAGAGDMLRVGANYNATVYTPCTVYEIMTSNTDLGSVSRGNIKSYINAQYSLSL